MGCGRRAQRRVSGWWCPADNRGQALLRKTTIAQEIPAGEGCKTRIYSYDEDGNRTTETTREPGTGGKCASEGGTTEWHTYDTANSLADPEVAYETFGNTTKLPAADAGGSALTSEYYVDSQVFKQEQGEQKIEYKLDPEERTLETISSGKPVDSTVVSHYDASGGAIAWTGEGSGEKEKWSRNIPGIGGALTATQKGEGKTGGAVVLLLHDLKGDVVAEAALSETETKLLKSYNSTEFGVPNGKEAPPKYAWLGAVGVAGELPSGVITQDGLSYVPQTGRPLQTGGVRLPAPENAATPFVTSIEAWVAEVAAAAGAQQVALAEEERKKREEANKPPGLIPSPEVGEEGGSIEVTEGPAGSGATIARWQGKEGGKPVAGCSAVFQIAATGKGQLVYGAELVCEHKKPHLEFEACLFKKYQGGHWEQEWCANEGRPAFAEDARGLWTGIQEGGCTDGFLYTGWVWGYIWGPGITAQAFGGVPPSETGAYVNCKGQDHDHELS
jgi:hypothetical protein